MKINPTNSIAFKAKIIDSHMHIGHWGNGKNWGVETLDKFIKNPLTVTINGTQSTDEIEHVIVSNLDCIGKTPIGEKEGLKQALEATKGNKKISLLAVCQPNLTQGNPKNLVEALNEAGSRVVGLKFHPRDLPFSPSGQKISASHEWYQNYLKIAQERKLPCLFHCDSDISGGSAIYRLAKNFPDVPVILGHTGAGSEMNFIEAKAAIRKSMQMNDAKLYCDISWMDWKNGLPDGVFENVKDLIETFKKIGALDRILFGTDAPLGCFGEKLEGGISEKEAYEKMVSGIKTMIKQNFGDEANDIIDKIFYKNAMNLFFPKNAIKTANKNINKTKLGATIGGVGIAFFGILKLIQNNKNKQKPTPTGLINIPNNISDFAKSFK
ncbi:MAG: amidohydrolase family protein [Candidatus Gastranaerophilales bacterium]|nr:amidohydrolase family protein [Candidatus Gastranaerophilales bacterium]